jgi:hypothetical protein
MNKTDLIDAFERGLLLRYLPKQNCYNLLSFTKVKMPDGSWEEGVAYQCAMGMLYTRIFADLEKFDLIEDSEEKVPETMGLSCLVKRAKQANPLRSQSKANFILDVLLLAKNYHLRNECDDKIVVDAAQGLADRYSELKGKMGFEDAARQAQVEFIITHS